MDTTSCFKSLGVTGSKLKEALKEWAEEAEQGSWQQRRDTAWWKEGVLGLAADVLELEMCFQIAKLK